MRALPAAPGGTVSIRKAVAGWWRSEDAHPSGPGVLGLGVGDDPEAGGPDVVGTEDPLSASDGFVVGVVVLGAEATPVAGAAPVEQTGRACTLGHQGAQSAGGGDERAEGKEALAIHDLGRDQDGSLVGGEPENPAAPSFGLHDL